MFDIRLYLYKNIKLHDVSLDEVKKTVGLINNLISGTPIDEVSQRLEFDIKPIISKTIKQYEAVYEIFYDAFNDFTKNSSNVFFSGKTNILKQPEYDNIDDILN